MLQNGGICPSGTYVRPLMHNTYLKHAWKLSEKYAWKIEEFNEDLLSANLAASNLHRLPNTDWIYIMFGVYMTCSTTEARKGLVNFIKLYEDDLSDIILGFLRLKISYQRLYLLCI